MIYMYLHSWLNKRVKFKNNFRPAVHEVIAADPIYNTLVLRYNGGIISGVRPDELILCDSEWKEYIPTVTFCGHEWKQYVGFTDVYEYCVKCDEKRT